jgi:hypothetical protein
MPQLIAFEVEVAIGKLKRYKSPGVDQIQAELMWGNQRGNIAF